MHVERRGVVPRETGARTTRKPNDSSAAAAAEPVRRSGDKERNAEVIRRNMSDGRELRSPPQKRTTEPPRQHERQLKVKPTPPHTSNGEEDAPHEEGVKGHGAFSEKSDERYRLGPKKFDNKEEIDEVARSKRARQHYTRARELGFQCCQDRYLRDGLYRENCDKDGHDADKLAEFEHLGNPENRTKDCHVPREVRVTREYKRWEERGTIAETDEGHPMASSSWEDRTHGQEGTWWGERAFGKSWSWKK